MEKVLNEKNEEKTARVAVLYRDDNPKAARCIWASIVDGEMSVFEDTKGFHLISVDYERSLEGISAMHAGLELGATNEEELAKVLVSEFGTSDGYDRLCDFLDECGIEYKDKRVLYNGPDDNPKGCDYLSHAEIAGRYMSMHVYRRRMFGHGADDDDRGIERISVKKLKKALGAKSNRELWQKMYKQFGVWDGHLRLERFLKDNEIHYTTWYE